MQSVTWKITQGQSKLWPEWKFTVDHRKHFPCGKTCTDQMCKMRPGAQIQFKFKLTLKVNLKWKFSSTTHTSDPQLQSTDGPFTCLTLDKSIYTNTETLSISLWGMFVCVFIYCEVSNVLIGAQSPSGSATDRIKPMHHEEKHSWGACVFISVYIVWTAYIRIRV